MQKYKLFGLAPPIWVAQYIYSIDIQRIIKCESKRCQSQENRTYWLRQNRQGSGSRHSRKQGILTRMGLSPQNTARKQIDCRIFRHRIGRKRQDIFVGTHYYRRTT